MSGHDVARVLKVLILIQSYDKRIYLYNDLNHAEN